MYPDLMRVVSVGNFVLGTYYAHSMHTWQMHLCPSSGQMCLPTHGICGVLPLVGQVGGAAAPAAAHAGVVSTQCPHEVQGRCCLAVCSGHARNLGSPGHGLMESPMACAGMAATQCAEPHVG